MNNGKDEGTLTDISPEDQRLFGQLMDFAARKAVNSVYTAQIYSKSIGAPVYLLVAFGEQALAINEMMMRAAVPDEPALIDRIKGTEW